MFAPPPQPHDRFQYNLAQIFGVMIPSSPGYIGTYHAAVVIGLGAFAVTDERALSVALMMHAAFFFPTILVGLIFLWVESLSLRDLITKSMEQWRSS